LKHKQKGGEPFLWIYKGCGNAQSYILKVILIGAAVPT
jgi:hypothetical protein